MARWTSSVDMTEMGVAGRVASADGLRCWRCFLPHQGRHAAREQCQAVRSCASLTALRGRLPTSDVALP